MRLFAIAVLVSACGGSGDEEIPSCQQAVTAFYGGGCAFVNLETGEPYTEGEIILSCRGIRAEAPSSCTGEIETFLLCLDSTTTDNGCDCTQEQEALLTCG